MANLLQLDERDGSPTHPLRRPHPRQHLTTHRYTEKRAGSTVNAKRAGLCQLRDLLVTAPEPLRSELRPLSRTRLLRRLAASRPHRRHDPELRGTLLALRAIARRVQQLTVEERELAGEIEQLISKLAPQLLNLRRPIARRPDRALLVTPRPPGQQGRLRQARRRRPDPRLLGPKDPLPARPRRRQATQPRSPPDHPHPTPNAPTDHRLHPAPPSRRKEPPRGHPLPQALPRPQPLPTPRAPANDGLTNIEASPPASASTQAATAFHTSPAGTRTRRSSGSRCSPARSTRSRARSNARSKETSRRSSHATTTTSAPSAKNGASGTALQRLLEFRASCTAAKIAANTIQLASPGSARSVKPSAMTMASFASPIPIASGRPSPTVSNSRTRM